MNYSVVPTQELLEVAGDLLKVADWLKRDADTKSGNRQRFLDELTVIDAELDTRIPEGEFCTLIDEAGQPVGFEGWTPNLAEEEESEFDLYGFTLGSFL